MSRKGDSRFMSILRKKRSTKERNPIGQTDSINNMRLDIDTKHFTNNKLQTQQL